MYIKYNDFELLYLIEEGSELAYQSMIDKYSYLIQTKLTDFHIKTKYRDDYFQEGLILLDSAINSFDEYRGKSFTTYFTVLLVFKIQKLLKLEKNYFYNVTLVGYPEILNENEVEYQGSNAQNFLSLDLSELERKVLSLYLNGYKPASIAKKIDVEDRSVYNAIGRVKLKMKENLKEKL